MGDRAEVSHQLRMSDDHVQRLGRWEDGGLHSSPDNEHRAWTGAPAPAAPHLRCGAACFCRWPTSGGGWEGRRAGRRRYGEVGGLCECSTHDRGLRRERVHSARPGTLLCGRGHVVAGGDVRRRRGQDSCPRTRQVSPAGADGTRPRGMSPPAVQAWSPQAAVKVLDLRQSCPAPLGNRSRTRIEEIGSGERGLLTEKDL